MVDYSLWTQTSTHTALSISYMGFFDTPYFRHNRYTKKCQTISDRSVLVRKHNSKIRSLSAMFVSTTAGVAFAYMTSGISLIGSVYAIRQFHILYQQAKIIELVLLEQGFDLPRVRVRDIIMGALIGSAAYAAGLGVAFGLEHLAQPVATNLTTALHNLTATPPVQHAAATLASASLPHAAMHTTALEATSVLHHTSTAANGVMTGLHDAVRVLVGHGQTAIVGSAHLAAASGQIATANFDASPAVASILGQLGGLQLAHVAGNDSASSLVSYLGEKGAGLKLWKRQSMWERLPKNVKVESGWDAALEELDPLEQLLALKALEDLWEPQEFLKLQEMRDAQEALDAVEAFELGNALDAVETLQYWNRRP